MIIKIKSTNQNLMAILGKNPHSFNGIQMRPMKRGVAIGRAYSYKEYHLVFQDTKYSFSGDMTNQIDFQSYCNPRAALNLFSVFARHMFVELESWNATFIKFLDKPIKEVDTEGHKHSIVIENIYSDRVRPSGDLVLKKYFPGITIEHKIGNLFTLTIESDRSVYHLMNLAAFVCLYLAATNKQPWYLTGDIARKYVRILSNIGPIPYFVAYLFARACLPSKELFDSVKDDLAECCGAKEISLFYGGTQAQRIKSVGEQLINEGGGIPYNVIEVGCGEMDYPKKYLGKLPDDKVWWAHDIENMFYQTHRVKRKHGRDNIFFTQEFGDIPKLDDTALILVEVIEHMPYEEAIALVVRAMNKFEPKLTVITTPNKKFNENYNFGESRELRHDDHHFELNYDELRTFISEVVEQLHFSGSVDIFNIGDVVDGAPMSFGVKLVKEGD